MTASHTKGLVRVITVVVYCLIFAPVLIASGGWSAASDTSTLAQRLIIYPGNGYTIGYPADWQVKSESQGIVAFVNPSTRVLLLVGAVSNPNGLFPPGLGLTIFGGVLTGMHNNGLTCHPTKGAGHATVAGVRWNRNTLTCSVSSGSRVLKVVVLAVNHPAASPSTRLFLIAYASARSAFNQNSAQFFLPMLRSFAFQ